MGASRGWQISAVLFGGIGIVFLLLGFGVNLGQWWPAFFIILGLASMIRGIHEKENVIFGLLFVGWSIGAIAALHHAQIEIIRNGWLFFIGVAIIWIPFAWLIGSAVTRETGD